MFFLTYLLTASAPAALRPEGCASSGASWWPLRSASTRRGTLPRSEVRVQEEDGRAGWRRRALDVKGGGAARVQWPRAAWLEERMVTAAKAMIYGQRSTGNDTCQRLTLGMGWGVRVLPQ